ncbi:D-arabinono-1,4-lactone oxidase [Allokutzneria multivorans]|uniref:D-arabinono-1,4-lactone oxidase n=1 Tax=Allokutzneria multivorans TaxID=1142134 RepID=A0ABP7RGD2_9PSEU
MHSHSVPATWTNWAGTATARPRHTFRPRDTEEIAEAVRTAEREDLPVRPVGSGHSFTSIAATDGVAIDLSACSGVISSDTATGLVQVHAGTTLQQLNADLDRLGLAMTNLGDIDRQTVAGAISTGTHGTGARFGGLATQVAALELVLADGSLLRCSAEENPSEFAAARVGLGALGVLSSVTLRCEPAYALEANEYPAPLEEVLERFDELAEGNDHFEFYWFPYGSKALVKRNNRLPAGAECRPLSPARKFWEYQVMENLAFGTVCRLGRAVPGLVRPLNRLSSELLSPRSYSDRSHRVFVTDRQVRFVESEYAIPRESVRDVLRELRAALPGLEHPVMFPVEVRVAAADDVWLSTAHGRDSAYIAVHQFVGMPHRHWFDVFESVVGAVGGRPHWGKMHRCNFEILTGRYPKFDEFRRVRAKVDPAGRFRNAYLDRVLGEI